MKRSLKILSLLLVMLLVCGIILTACGGNEIESSQTSTNESKETTEASVTTDSDATDTSKDTETSAVSTGGNTEEGSESKSDMSNDSASETTEGDGGVTSDSDESTENEEIVVFETENIVTTESEEPIVTEYIEIIDYEGSKIVEYADHIKDGANAYYLDRYRTAAVVENMKMRLVHGLNGNLANASVRNLINSIENKDGGVYIKNTMDAFVKTTDGKTYFASEWVTGSSFNVLRGGYYYQEVRVQDQGFGDVETILSGAIDISVSEFVSTSSNQIGDLVVGEDGILSYTVLNTGADPGNRDQKRP